MNNLKINWLRILTAVLIFSLAAIYSLLWARMMADPVLYTGTDFISFYAVGRIADNEGATYVYDIALQEKYEEEIVGYDITKDETNIFIHPPFVVPLIEATVTKEYLPSFQRWSLLMVFFFAMSIPFLVSVTSESLLREKKISLATGLFLYFPSFLSILLGQDNALMFLGVALWIWGVFYNKDWVAGCGLALTTIRPHLALFLLVQFIFRRRVVLGWFVFFTAMLGLLSLIYAGFHGAEGFFNILTTSSGGENLKTHEEDMINLLGVLRRVFPEHYSTATRMLSWGFYMSALLSIIIYHLRGGGKIEGDLSLAAVMAVFFSPHSHVQDLLLFIIPITILIRLLLEKQIISSSVAVLIPLMISLILLFSYSSPILIHSTPYFLMIGLLYLVWRNQKTNSEKLLDI